MKEDAEYDIAISFCYEDEDLAIELRDALEGLKVFVYSKAQEELAGTDGMQSFIDTFKHNSRTIVLLHRDKWGTTKWTRVEENAIKDWCLDGHWDGLFVVRTAHSTSLPKWVPSTHLYFDVNEFPFEQLVGAIKARAKERGSDLQPETVAEKGKRMAARHAFEKETRELIRSHTGITQAREAVGAMFETIASEAAIISDAGIEIKCEMQSSAYFVVRAEGVSMVMNWQHYSNSIDGCPLGFRIFRGCILLPSERGRYYTFDEPALKGQFKFEIDRTRALGWCFRADGESRALSSQQAGQYVLERFLKAYDECKSAQQH